MRDIHPRARQAHPVYLSGQTVSELGMRELARLRDAREGYLRVDGYWFEVQWIGDGMRLATYGDNAAARATEVSQALHARYRELGPIRPRFVAYGSEYIRLNGRAPFAHDGAKRIVCRHLAVHWIGMFLEDRAHEPQYIQLRTEEDITRHVDASVEGVSVALLRLCKLQAVQGGDWGVRLAKLFRKLEGRGEDAIAVYVGSTTHAMALGLKTHQRGDRRVYQVAFYDPERTATHLTATFPNLDAVSLLHARYFLAQPSDGDDDAYARIRHPDVMTMTDIGEADLRMLRERHADAPPRPRKLSGTVPPPGAELLWYLLHYNCVDAIHRLVPSFREAAVHQRYAWLANTGSVPPFHFALVRGHPDTVRAFGALVADLPLPMRASLLQACHPDGTPAFGAALAGGRADMIGPFWDLTRSLLPQDWHYPLMRAASADGTSALYRIFAQDGTALLTAYARETLDMPPMQLAVLMNARSANDEPGLVAAVRLHRARTLAAFAEVLSRLAPQACTALLAPAWRAARALRRGSEGATATRDALRRLVQDYAPGLIAGAPVRQPALHR